tara:strand:- start:1177 stop:1377 length:201 start_codon:yes stop_codon:yes gene_type:complete
MNRPTTVFDVLTQQIDEQRNASVKFLMTGGPKDFSQYKEVTGLIRGFETSISIIKELQRNQEEKDD